MQTQLIDTNIHNATNDLQNEVGQQLDFDGVGRRSEVMSRSERLIQEDARNMLILLEHYKIQLTLVLPKVCFVVRKAQQKNKKRSMTDT